MQYMKDYNLEYAFTFIYEIHHPGKSYANTALRRKMEMRERGAVTPLDFIAVEKSLIGEQLG